MPILCQFCLGRKQSSYQLLRMVRNSTSEPWNVTPLKWQPLPREGGREVAWSRGWGYSSGYRALWPPLEKLTLLSDLSTMSLVQDRSPCPWSLCLCTSPSQLDSLFVVYNKRVAMRSPGHGPEMPLAKGLLPLRCFLTVLAQYQGQRDRARDGGRRGRGTAR